MTKDFTLEDIGKLIQASEERFKEYADSRFNWLAEQMMEGFEKAQEALNLFKIETRREFRGVNKKIDLIQRNNEARLSLAEDGIRQLQKDVL